MFYIESSKDITRKLLELISEFSKVHQEFRIQNKYTEIFFTFYIVTVNCQENWENKLIYSHMKKSKVPWMSLSMEENTCNSENFKTPLE